MHNSIENGVQWCSCFVCFSTTDLPALAPLGLGTFTQTSGSLTLTFLTFLMNTHSVVEGIFLSFDSTREKAIWVLDFLKAKPGHCRSTWPHLPNTQDHEPVVCPAFASSQMADPGYGGLISCSEHIHIFGSLSFSLVDFKFQNTLKLVIKYIYQ